MPRTASHASSLPFLRALRTVSAALLLLVAVCSPAWARFEPVTCHNSFTEDQEITEGQKAALQVYRSMPVLPENDPVTQYVQSIGAKLVHYAPLAAGVTHQWPFNFHVVASDEINAFALPGGSIFVNLGTVQAADTEAQLAGVMAHEISHVVMRHSTCNIGRQQTHSLLYGLGAIGSAILLGNGAAGQLAQGALGFGQNLDFLHMSRGDEQQADLLGTDILYNAGYDPRGLPQFFEIIRGKYGAGGAQFLSDHPNPGNRTEYVDREIATLPRRSNPVVNTPEFKRVHAIAAEEKALTSKGVQAGAWRRSGNYASGPGSNGAVVSAQAGSAAGAPAAASIAPLSRGQLGLSDSMTTVSTASFTLRAPQSWTQSTDQNGTVTLTPPGGAQNGAVAYGVLVGLLKNSGTAQSTLANATSTLLASFTGQGSGLAQAGSVATTRVGSQPANSVALRGASPVTVNNSPLPEQDRLVSVSRPDGNVSYLIFVSPQQDLPALQPVFDSILASFRPR